MIIVYNQFFLQITADWWDRTPASCAASHCFNPLCLCFTSFFLSLVLTSHSFIHLSVICFLVSLFSFNSLLFLFSIQNLSILKKTKKWIRAEPPELQLPSVPQKQINTNIFSNYRWYVHRLIIPIFVAATVRLNREQSQW